MRRLARRLWPHGRRGRVIGVCVAVVVTAAAVAWSALERLGIALAYVLITLLFVAGLAFALTVSTDSPLGAVGGTVGLAIVSNILDAVTALGSWREILPTHWQYSWLSALQPQVSWDPMIEGAVVSASYAVILLAFAFRRFARKDIVS